MEGMVFTMAKRWLRIAAQPLGILMLVAVCGIAPKGAFAEELSTSTVNDWRPVLVEDERAWYGASCTFSDSWSSPRRYYDGENVGIEMSTQSSGAGSFTVQLYKSNRLIGSKAVTKNGFARATWENVGSGEYHFKFVDRSGSRIACSDIAMFSW